LQTEYVPRCITGDNSRKLAPNTVYNIYVSLSSYFTWVSREFDIPNPIKNVPRPRVPNDAPAEPFRKGEIELLINTCDFFNEAGKGRRRKFMMKRAIAKRDKAILLTLLDSRVRASELYALLVGDVDIKSGKVTVKSGEAGKAKGGKGRIVCLGKNRPVASSGVIWPSERMGKILTPRFSSVNFTDQSIEIHSAS
jgi:integrase